MDELESRFYKFALNVIKIVNGMPKTTAGFEMGRQLFRSGTSIAANYAEAKGAYSTGDFTYKLSISFKEARETCLWLHLADDSSMLNGEKKLLLAEAREIRNILGKSVKTLRMKKLALQKKQSN